MAERSRALERLVLTRIGAEVTARVGNVIGGGDWSAARIVSDLWRAQQAAQAVSLHYPLATRAWRHVLEPIAGYLDFAEALVEDVTERTLNFGPGQNAPVTVSELVDAFQRTYGASSVSGWPQAPGQHLKEAPTLAIDASRAIAALPWRPRLAPQEAIAWTAAWYAAYDRGLDMAAYTDQQIADSEDRLA